MNKCDCSSETYLLTLIFECVMKYYFLFFSIEKCKNILGLCAIQKTARVGADLVHGPKFST